ncbi:alpha/beta hydrolase [Lapillicoccus sp.]|uniref:alpha/beta fold hydrolase n=1 Tax=Lapillicoccus sp. TaxID=1909287 RepID=UPI003262E0E6
MPVVKTAALLSLHYEDTGGHGRPVVLIHGWPLSEKSWSLQVPALEEAGYRVVTYDRRGFGESDKPGGGLDYDMLADDLASVIDGLGLDDVTLVGFSMGGGEVARYIGRHGEVKIHSVVFASAVPPFLEKTNDNPDGGMSNEDIEGMVAGVHDDREGFLDPFTTAFFSAGDELMVTEEQRQEALDMQAVAEQSAVEDCVEAFSRTDFRADLAKIAAPTLVIHGDSDGIVPFEVSGKRTHEAIDACRLVVIEKGPHGLNVSHADQFNAALLEFLDD